MFIDPTGLLIRDGAAVINGQAQGPVAQTIGGVRYEPGLLRPFLNDRGQRCMTVNVGMKYNPKTGEDEPQYKTFLASDLAQRGIYSPITENAATLPKNAWIQLDSAIVRATRQRLRAWADLVSANPFGGFNAMGRMTLEYQAMTDPGEAVVDMDALTDGRTDRPLFNLKSIPLPITHSDFYFSEREIAVSRNTGTPLDSTMGEAAGRRVAETIEQTVIGTITGVQYGTQSAGPGAHTGDSQVYGYTNFPYRITKTDLTPPTGTNPEAIVSDVLEMVELLEAAGFYGPYMLYHSTGYSRYLNDDYFRTGSTSAVRTVRERIMEIEGISGIRRLDYLTSGYQMILLQMTPDVAQAINGMPITTVQWPTMGGLRQNFKVMAIQVPLLRSPYNGTAGIVHGTTA